MGGKHLLSASSAYRTAALLMCLLAGVSLVHSNFDGIFIAGVTTSQTGPFAEWSDAVNGYKLWAQQLTDTGGFTLRDANGTTHRYGIKLVVYDDASSADSHKAALSQLLTTDGAHFILGASPAFAETESVQVHAAGRLNFHCCTGASSVFARDQRDVFGLTTDNVLYTQELFMEFRSANVYKLAIMYRSDVKETQSACEGVVLQAQSQLLSVVLQLSYTNSTNATLDSLASQLAGSAAEALVMCGLEGESEGMARRIDALRKPLKAIVFTGGAYKRSWNDRLGNLSVSVLSFTHWSPDLPRKDDFWGTSSSYAGKYKSVFGADATQTAAAASATGYVLQSVLSDVFSRCVLSPAALTDPSALLFTPGAIACSDNNNRGHDRLVAALALANMQTFFGDVAFNRFRQNTGYDPVTLQTYESLENLQLIYKPSLVLPLSSATRPLLLPQHNRYAPTCQPGTYRGDDEFADCTPCSPGQFQEFAGRHNCELCPKDSYANSSAMPTCLACPDNTLTTQRASTNLTDCNCKPGFYNRLGQPGLPCEPCPADALCLGGTAPPSPLHGFYAERDQPFTMYRCNPTSACTGNFTCRRGYRGRMCAYCEEGYFRFLGRCVSCPQDKSVVLGYLIILGFLWIILNVYLARAVENLMVVVGFCQLISIVVGFSLNWPERLYSIMSICSILSFEIDSLEPTCLVPNWGFAHNLVVQLLLPLIMAALVAGWSLVTYLIYLYKQRRMSRSAKAAASLKLAFEAPWKQMLWEMLDVPAEKRELREMLLERAAIPLNFLNIGFLVLFKYNLSVFSCRNIMGVEYLSASPNDQCYTPKHYNLILLGVSGFICYNMGFLFLYGHAMRQLRKHRALGDKTPLLLYGWMYERYEAEYYCYEIVSIVQRVSFVLVALFVTDPALQAVLALVFNVGIMLVDIHYEAYVDRIIHTLQAVTEGVLGALLVAGLLFYNPLSDKGVVDTVELVLLVLLVASLASAAVSVVYAVTIRLMVMWLMSKHRPVAHKVGQRVKGYRHVYKVFGPIFLFNWLRRCTPEEWDDWHRLCMVLIDYVHPTSEVSYLSLKKVGRFWRYLLLNFPETIDYLVAAQEADREAFNTFIEVLYEDFFDTRDEHNHQVYYYINDKYKAAFAQWLSSSDNHDRVFCQRIMKTALAKVKGVQAATELSAAMTRASKIGSTLTVLSAVERFKKGRPNSANAPDEFIRQSFLAAARSAAAAGPPVGPSPLAISSPSPVTPQGKSLPVRSLSVRFRSAAPDDSAAELAGRESGGGGGKGDPTGGPEGTAAAGPSGGVAGRLKGRDSELQDSAAQVGAAAGVGSGPGAAASAGADSNADGTTGMARRRIAARPPQQGRTVSGASSGSGDGGTSIPMIFATITGRDFTGPEPFMKAAAQLIDSSFDAVLPMSHTATENGTDNATSTEATAGRRQGEGPAGERQRPASAANGGGGGPGGAGGGLRRITTLKRAQSPGGAQGDVVLHLGNPEVEELELGAEVRGDGGGEAARSRASPPRPLRGDSADSLYDNNGEMGSQAVFPVLSAAAPRAVGTPRATGSAMVGTGDAPVGGNESRGQLFPRPSFLGLQPRDARPGVALEQEGGVGTGSQPAGGHAAQQANPMDGPGQQAEPPSGGVAEVQAFVPDDRD